jgi:hypothetical protein
VNKRLQLIQGNLPAFPRDDHDCHKRNSVGLQKSNKGGEIDQSTFCACMEIEILQQNSFIQ